MVADHLREEECKRKNMSKSKKGIQNYRVAVKNLHLKCYPKCMHAYQIWIALFLQLSDKQQNYHLDLAFKQAVERARRGKGPSVIISNVVRLMPHSSSDDQRKYRTEKSLEEDLKRDPII